MTYKQHKITEQIRHDLEPEISSKNLNIKADEYLLNINNDLNQVDRLINDAVTNLTINFKHIDELSKSHHEMVMAIEKLSIPNESKPVLELLNKQMLVAEKIERELGSAVISLQFGDLVSQLLAHTTKKIEMLNLALQRIDRAGNSKKNPDKSQERSKEISQAIQLTHSMILNNPVVQQEMSNGEIELF